MFRHLRYACGAPVRYRMLRQAQAFASATIDCRTSQRNVLAELLKLNAGSRFSRDFGLDRVATVDDFRRALPVANYERARPYIEDLKRGESSALLGPGNPLLMFSLTSGTTSDSKFIPITGRFLRDYRRGWQIWGIRAYTAHRRLQLLQMVQLASDHDKFRTPSGTPCGNISGLVQQMQCFTVRSYYSIPPQVVKVGDPEAKYYAALRFALADRHIGLLMTANPSTLVHLAQLADRHKESLIRDIHDGTLSRFEDAAGPAALQLARKARRRQRSRAKELDRIVQQSGRLLPRDAWPHLNLLAVWLGGSAGAYRHRVREFYGDVPCRDHGLSASEGRMTIPLEDETSSGVLDVTTHFFEFIPEAEIDSDDPTVLEAHELEEGQNYFILLTTASGLYRYDIHDVVRCTGFAGTTPMLEFLHKGAHIASVTGEKLTESQVARAVADSASGLRAPLGLFTLAPVWGDPPHYRLMTELDPGTQEEDLREVVETIDGRLRDLNCEYREKQETGRLGGMQLTPLPPGTWERYARQRQAGPGGSVEQYKHPALSPKMTFHDEVIDRFAAPPVAVETAGRQSV
ncbi:GH3 auxin-responsive promoter [Maioricimonas rarisocia]|uniref:GH3 auxin-responsive promoter n=1 Tax=Maioricimonas rarisocia TaxID=2528026 RepID=A0A517Z4S4_9PLAN|nr:GH3 auxin-responsive promoter family protein [Maioricimonas rarisocia]QDU37427.1 GH3 auxin-responsive promoter [Maioricimonas rarisocia]